MRSSNDTTSFDLSVPRHPDQPGHRHALLAARWGEIEADQMQAGGGEPLAHMCW